MSQSAATLNAHEAGREPVPPFEGFTWPLLLGDPAEWAGLPITTGREEADPAAGMPAGQPVEAPVTEAEP